MEYSISYQHPSRQYIDIEFSFENNGAKRHTLQLPAWRPGRYELGNFAKNIRRIHASNEKEQSLKIYKISKETWIVESANAETVRVSYSYYAAELNAGSSYLDEKQLYVNPVNCCIYIPERQEEACFLKLCLPEDYQVAIALKELETNVFKANNFDQLADSPFIASASMQKFSYHVANCTFYCWFQGEVKVDEKKLINDFMAFTKAQVELFGSFPCDQYHFLFQILPYSGYHGVEHADSTVIALGPGTEVFKKNGRYEDLLGVSSHELFHTWNVKRIRPKEWWPYDFSQENYSKLGYLAEGATTWYGDEMLKKSGVFDDQAYFKTIEQLLDRHFNNPGVYNLSVAESSFDTWIDGYVPGVPNRKASIYVEGALITLLLDVKIRQNSKDKHSFDDVMRTFYKDFYEKGKGVGEEDYKTVVERYAEEKLDSFFDDFIYGVKDLRKELIKAFKYNGLSFESLPSDIAHEAYYGFRYIDNKVYSVFPDSPADFAGLSIGDEIIGVNGMRNKENLDQLMRYHLGEKVSLSIAKSNGSLHDILFESNREKIYYAKHKVKRI